MKKYYMFNMDDTQILYIGYFNSDTDFWNHYRENENEIIEKQFKLDRFNKIWYFVSYDSIN